MKNIFREVNLYLDLNLYLNYIIILMIKLIPK
nr:MAG TPA: hypothetical protein [Caudoviricetes sp.]